MQTTLIDRIESKYVPVTEAGCWLWIGATTGTGDYGRIKDTRANKYVLAHRVVYELYRGFVPENMDVSHCCPIHCCVNPWHMKLIPSSKGFTVRERFDAKWKLADKGDCWVWTATIDTSGYGTLKVNGKMRRAHRIAYELYRELIPPDLQIDHLCRVRCCVNPWHMEFVTSGENTRRGISPALSGERMRAKTHCPHGHRYSEKNTYRRSNGDRVCRACDRNRRSAYTRW